MNRDLVKRTRRPRGSGVPRVLISLTAEQYPVLHEYCLTRTDIDLQQRYQRKRTGNVYIPKTPMVPVCEHPEHGFCSHNPPTPQQIAEINARLAGYRVAEEIIEAVKKLHPKKIPILKGHGFSDLQAKAKKKRKYTKKPGVVYGRPKR